LPEKKRGKATPDTGDDDLRRALHSLLDDAALRLLRELEALQSGSTKQILDATIANANAKQRFVHLTRILAQCFTFGLLAVGLSFGFILLLNGKHTEGLVSILACAGGGGAVTLGRTLLGKLGRYEIKKKDD